MEYILVEFEYVLRIIIAGICGAVIGYERKSRLKEAGVRTHFIVALASALMMIVSKYGFADLYDGINGIRGADPSRIAASIVSGVGFLGAGAIFVRKQIIQGLTTAAGIWATSGVGMAIGAGMYFLGIFSAVIILFVQIFLHKTTWFTKKIPVSENISVVAENSGEIFDSILKTLKDNSLEVLSITSEISENEKLMTLNMSLKVPYSFDVPHVVSLFAGHPGVRSVDI